MRSRYDLPSHRAKEKGPKALPIRPEAPAPLRGSGR
jgi:hypothetical protein